MNRASSGFGYVELVSTSIIWGVTYVLLKYALSYLDPQQIAFSRFLVSSVFFIPLIFVIRERYSRREILTLFILALTGVLLYQLLFIWGESGLTAGNASFIVSLEPIFIASLGVRRMQKGRALLPQIRTRSPSRSWDCVSTGDPSPPR